MIEINEFYEDLLQDILGSAETRGEMQAQSFFEVFTSSLIETGDLTKECEYTYFHKVGIEVSGWDFDEEKKMLTLLICDQFDSENIQTLSKSSIDSRFKRLFNFYNKSIEKFYENLEETSDAFKLAYNIFDKYCRNEYIKVRLMLLTNGKLTKNVNEILSQEVNGIKIEYQIIDIEYLYKTKLSQFIEEDIELDVNIPCLKVDTSKEYSSYLAVIDGETICNIYENLGKKVLDENVRTFLQFKGGVNKGIRSTIENKPEYFFAYNNGITATAKGIELNENKDKIIKIKNLQIVNGGQTTSSIYRAKSDSKDIGIDFSQIFVQMKLSLIEDKNNYQDFVQNISRYANTQNKVNESDFFSNHEFHKEFSSYSKRIWAPPKYNKQKKTRWFYERVRGEYLNDLALCSTPVRKLNFKLDSPKDQVLDKVFLSKSENVWGLRPVEVCKGAQYSFKIFAEAVVKEYSKNNEMITETYFKNAVSRAIIFKKLEKLISKSEWYDGGYRAQTVAYTLAYLSNYLQENKLYFNFNLIWEAQDIYDDLLILLEKLSYKIYKIITKPLKGYSNIGEWCKKDSCWQTVKNENIELVFPQGYLLEKEEQKEVVKKEKKEKKEEVKIDYLIEIASVKTEDWIKIYTYYSRHNELTSKDSNLILKMSQGGLEIFYPNDKQAKSIFDVYRKSKNEGIL